MAAANHPAYEEELERCRYTLDYVEKALQTTANKKKKLDVDSENVKKHQSNESSLSYVDIMVNALLQSSMELKLRNLQAAINKPYFARVDFLEESESKPEKLYIGKMSLMRDEDHQVIIVDWRAPIANLYYEERLGEAHYLCPDGDVKGKMILKRQFSIEDGQLNEVFDIDITTNDDFLQSYLGANADNRLKEIVSTIQVEQNRIIRAGMWKPLIVQGAAGSGKTTIALHRLAYLIYNHEKTFKPENFMIIAPSRFFLNYISEVLPELGVERVVQSTFESFAMELLGKKFKIKDPNDKLVEFIESKEGWHSVENSNLYKISKLKASMDFKGIIDKYIELVEENFIPKQHFIFEGIVVYKYAEIKRLFLNEYKHLPLVKRIDEIKKHLNNRMKLRKDDIVNKLYEISDERVLWLKENMEENDERQQLIIEAIDGRIEKVNRIEANFKTAVNNYVKLISKLNPWEYYIELMNNPKLLESLLEGIEEAETAKFMSSYTSKVLSDGFVEIEDFAPLTYLKYCIHGIDEKIPVRQIIIDEAQDFSVFQLYALKKIIKDSSFSILGDLAQGIHSHRGIRDWKDVIKHVFYDKQPEHLTLEQSYRTTVEIMDAANKIIEILDPTGGFSAKPVIRHGMPVELVDCKNEDDELKHIIKMLEEVMPKGFKSVAVICRTPSECAQMHKKLKKKFPQINLITGKETQYKGGMVVVPSYLSKGLEFDVVIVADAQSFNDGDLDVKLLYVSMTRALHILKVFYCGELTRTLRACFNEN